MYFAICLLQEVSPWFLLFLTCFIRFPSSPTGQYFWPLFCFVRRYCLLTSTGYRLARSDSGFYLGIHSQEPEGREAVNVNMNYLEFSDTGTVTLFLNRIITLSQAQLFGYMKFSVGYSL